MSTARGSIMSDNLDILQGVPNPMSGDLRDPASKLVLMRESARETEDQGQKRERGTMMNGLRDSISLDIIRFTI
jgi:hypothetical protein